MSTKLNSLANPLIMILLGVALCLGACGSGEDSPEDGGNDNNAMLSDAGDDATSADMGGDAETVGRFQIGTNPLNEANPDGFMPFSEGTAVPFVYGVQGSWMVVLAFRTDMIEGMFEVRANITIDGVESGNIWLEQQQTFPGGDGWDYYYSLFLAIDGEPPPEGTPVHIGMTVTDENGTTAEQEYDLLAGSTDGP